MLPDLTYQIYEYFAV